MSTKNRNHQQRTENDSLLGVCLELCCSGLIKGYHLFLYTFLVSASHDRCCALCVFVCPALCSVCVTVRDCERLQRLKKGVASGTKQLHPVTSLPLFGQSVSAAQNPPCISIKASLWSFFQLFRTKNNYYNIVNKAHTIIVRTSRLPAPIKNHK